MRTPIGTRPSRGEMNCSPVSIEDTLIAWVQRDLEEQQRLREKFYRDLDDDWDRDRER